MVGRKVLFLGVCQYLCHALIPHPQDSEKLLQMLEMVEMAKQVFNRSGVAGAVLHIAVTCFTSLTD